MAHTFRREGDLWRLAASFGFPSEYVAYWQALGAVPYDAESPLVLLRERPAGLEISQDRQTRGRGG
jgi:hypothetical protein